MPGLHSVRRAAQEDQHLLGRMWLQFLQEQAQLDPRFRVADDALDRWENDFPFWLRDKARRILVAELRDELVGFISAQRWSAPPVYAESSEVYIDELFVRHEVRGHRIGTTLVEAMRAWAIEVGANRLRMGVLAQNDRVDAFWRRLDARPFAVTLTVELHAGKETARAPGRIGF
jgi:GNAT superfamily N-acetyltransferase